MATPLSTPVDLSLVEIMARFRADEDARAYLEAVRWPNGPTCPKCANADVARIYPIAANASAKIRPGLRECGECKGQFTVTVGTIFEDSKVPLSKWLIAWYLLCSSKKGFSAAQLQRTLALGSYRTAWFMLHRIRFAMKDPEFGGKMMGTVGADETWAGGEAKGFGCGCRDSQGKVTDGERTVEGLKKVEGKRLMLRRQKTKAA